MGQTSMATHGKALCVSVYDRLSDLVRRFPELRPVVNRYRRDGEKRIKDLQIPAEEKQRLLYQILSLKRADDLCKSDSARS